MVPLQLADLSTLEMYLDGVMTRSKHRASKLGGIALALVGAVLWKKDDAPIQITTNDGRPDKILWIQIGGQRYCLAYNHHEECIDLRAGTLSGEVLHSFTNATPVAEVWQIFENLKPTLRK
jgi:hypothetical protein